MNRSLTAGMAWLTAAGLLAGGSARDQAKAALTAEFLAAFDAVHQTVAEQFFDPQMRGLNWGEIGEQFRLRASEATSLDEFGEIVNQMLSQLNTSHTHFYTSRDPAYYQLLGVFKAPMFEQIRAAHPENPNLKYAGIGIFTKRLDGKMFVSGVLEGTPASDAGLRTGDHIINVEGEAFHPIGSFEGRAGRETALRIQRSADPASAMTVNVTPVMLDPASMFVTAMERSVRLIERPPFKIGYIHLWSFAGEPYHELLRTEITSGRLRDADALILDFRDGWGGSNPEDLNMFNDRVPHMTHINRMGEEQSVDPQWRKPVGLLVNEGSRSGKEVFAYGFQKHHIGPVIGERTAGAVVGGRPFLIRPGMLLYLAVIDVRVDGERLEGVGVQPDVEVPFELRYANGADPQLDAAVEAMEREVNRPAEAGRP